MKPWRCMNTDMHGPTRLLDPLLEKAGNQKRLSRSYCDDLFLYSDYSGQDKKSSFETYSYLLVDKISIRNYFESIESFRNKRLNTGEHVAYKKFAKRSQQESFRYFIDAAKEKTCGNLITIAVDKRLKSLINGHKIMFKDGMDPIAVKNWNSLPNGTAEQTARIIHFAALIVSGLSPENSSVTWISDKDETIANQNRKDAFWAFFISISSLYLHTNMNKCWLGDSGLNQKCMRIEDALTLPDVAAGSFRECLDSGLANAARYPNLWTPDSMISPKALNTLHRFTCRPTDKLKSIFLALESTSTGMNAFEYIVPLGKPGVPLTRSFSKSSTLPQSKPHTPPLA